MSGTAAPVQMFAGVGFLLCDCCGDGGADVAAVAEAVRQACPGAGARVVAQPCRRRDALMEALSALEDEGRTIVVGACADEGRLAFIREAIAWRSPRAPRALVADVRGPAGAPLPGRSRLLARFRGLGWRALAHAAAAPAPMAIRVRRQRHREEDGPLAIARPDYGVVPRVDPQRCLAGRGCRFCLGSCPENALLALGECVQMLSYRCQGCGGCVASCRFGAVDYPMWSAAECLAEISGLMAGPGAPRTLVMGCPYVLAAMPERERWPEGVEAVALPCLARLDPLLLLHAGLLGAVVVVVDCSGACGRHLAVRRPRRAVTFAGRVLEAGGRPGAVRWAAPEEAADGGWLKSLGGDARAPAAPASAIAAPFPWTAPALAELVARCLGGAGDVRLSGGDVPFGWVEARPGLCTGCAACAHRCPTQALRVVESAGSASLEFAHDRCVACGFCVAACAPRALSMRRMLAAEWLGRRAVLARWPRRAEAGLSETGPAETGPAEIGSR